MKPITIVGFGRVGTHLLKIFHEKNLPVRQIFTRSITQDRSAMAGRCHVELVHDFQLLENHKGIYILAVPDRHISDVAQQLKAVLAEDVLIAHSSGTTPLKALAVLFSQAGRFYPLQSFSTEAPVHWEKLPVFVSGTSPQVKEALKQLANAITEKVVVLKDEEQWAWLHLGAVIAHNFSNAMFHWSKNMLEQHGLKFEYLHPLIRDGLAKSMLIGPEAAQTGPAQRGDLTTIATHLELLKNDKALHDLYLAISQMINSNVKIPEK